MTDLSKNIPKCGHEFSYYTNQDQLVITYCNKVAGHPGGHVYTQVGRE